MAEPLSLLLVGIGGIAIWALSGDSKEKEKKAAEARAQLKKIDEYLDHRYSECKDVKAKLKLCDVALASKDYGKAGQYATEAITLAKKIPQDHFKVASPKKEELLKKS
jgi:hypothetical protein